MGDHIGERVRRARLWRGMTQQQLADLAGWTHSAVSMLETGRRGLDSRARLRQLAEALRVDPTDLTGEPYPADAPGMAEAQASVPALQAALMDYRIGESPGYEPRPLAELQAVVRGPMMRTALAADTTALLGMLPALILELQAHGTSEAALRALTAACIEAMNGLKLVGQVPSAWIAAARAAEAAALVGDPVLIGAAEFARAHARRAEGRTMARAEAAADRIPADRLTEPWAQEVYGMLRLTAALAAQVRGDSVGAEDQAAEAARVAELHGERGASGWAAPVLERGISGDPGSPTWECFGPANVGIWRTLLAVERGEPARALELAAAVDTAALPWRRRHADLLLDVARAHQQMGRGHDRQAVAALREAERLATHTRYSPWARDLVQTMLARSRREAGGRELRGLAFRMGL